MTKHIKYQLATTAGYKHSIVKIGFELYDPLAYYHKENFPDVEVIRDSFHTDLSLLHTKALMTVNGYVYPTEFSGNRLYIPNATKSMLKSRANHIGILSLNSLSSPIVKTPILPEMISRENTFTTQYNKSILTFDRDVGHCILVVNGYLIFEDPEIFYRVSSNSFALRVDRIQYLEKLYELNRYRDIFEELEIPTSINNPSVVSTEVAISDEKITKFLSTFNSFLIELPVTSITTNKIYLEHSNIPGNFRTELEVRYPFISGYGKMSEYVVRKNNDSKYTVYSVDSFYRNHLMSYLNPTIMKIHNDNFLVGDEYRLSQGFFLDVQLEE